MLRFFRALAANLILLIALLLTYAIVVIASVNWGAKPRPHPLVDVVFVFDTTDSMQDKIDGLLSISSRFAGELAGAGADYRLAMVSFGAIDEPQVIRETFGPGASVSDFQQFLRSTSASGGGCEDQPTAVKTAMTRFTYRPHAKKIMILITDERILGNESYSMEDVPDDRARQAIADWSTIIDDLVDQKFTVYAVCIPVDPYKQIADRTNGKFYDIQHGNDFTDIVMDIAAQINASLTR